MIDLTEEGILSNRFQGDRTDINSLMKRLLDVQLKIEKTYPWSNKKCFEIVSDADISSNRDYELFPTGNKRDRIRKIFERQELTGEQFLCLCCGKKLSQVEPWNILYQLCRNCDNLTRKYGSKIPWRNEI